MRNKAPSVPAVSKPLLSQRFWWVLLAFLAVAHALLVGWVKLRVAAWQPPVKDWPLYCNLLATTRLGGPWLESDFLRLSAGSASYLREHFAPTLLLLAPVYRLLDWPQALLCLQAAMPGLTALLLAGLAQAWGAKGSRVFWAGALWLLHPWVLRGALDLPQQFHHDCLMPPLIVGALLAWALDKRAAAWALAVLALGLKENLPPMGLMLAAWLYFRGQRKEAAWLAGLSAACLAVAVLPWGSEGSSRHVDSVLNGFHSSWPAQWGLLRWWWPVLAWWPVAGASAWWAWGLPVIFTHNASGLVPGAWHVWPVLTAGAVAGAAGLARPALGLRRALGPVLGLALGVLLWPGLVGAWHQGNERPLFAAVDLPGLRAIGEKVPPNAVLAASQRCLPYLANRPHLAWLEHVEDADYALIELLPGTNSIYVLENIRKLKSRDRLRQILRTETFELFLIRPLDHVEKAL